MRGMMKKMSGAGDELVAEWTEITSEKQLSLIQEEYTRLIDSGYTPGNLKTGKLMSAFDPDAEILMIQRMRGGKTH